MLLFKYTARDSNGTLITDSKQAQDRSALISELRKQNLFVISITEATSHETRPFVFRFNPSAKHITHITHQLASLLSSGIVLTKALALLVKQVHQAALRESLVAIRDEVAGGGHFWEALSRHPGLFSKSYVSMVKAGEISGNLEVVMTRLADFLEQRQRIKSEITGVLIYPCLLLLVGFGTVVFLMTYVVPKLAFIFSDMQSNLPLATKLLFGISMFLSRYGWFLLILIALVCYIVKVALARADWRLDWDKRLYNLPFIGRIQQQAIFVHFAHLLGLLLSSGVSMTEAMSVACDFITNSFVAKRLIQAQKDISEGASLSASLEKTGLFSPLMVEAIAVGEEAGTLEQSLLKTAVVYEREAGQELKRMLGLLEPLIIFLLALVVGFLVMSILLPIFEMNLQMG